MAITETVVRRCSVKKVFLEISQNSQESTCKESLVCNFIKKESLVCNFIKKESLVQVLPCGFCEISQNTFFYRTPQVAASKLIVFKKIRDSLTNFTFSF